MAETVHLYLQANGSDIKGESTQHSLGREGSIECIKFEHEVTTAREASSGMASGRRTYRPLKIRKRIDASSPLLMKAMVENQVVKGNFKFFRPDPSGNGQTQHFYTVGIDQGRIDGMKQESQDTLNPADANHPPMEEVTFVFHEIMWTFEPNGATHVDSWSNHR